MHDKLIVVQLTEEWFVLYSNRPFIAETIKARQGHTMNQLNAASTPSFSLYDIHFNIIRSIHNNHQHMHTFSFDTIKL